MAPALPRPRQVTIAGWMIIAGSAAVVLAVFQQIAGLHTIDTREGVERALDGPPFDGTGLTVDEVLGVVRVLSMVAAACATATAILGWHVLQRSKSSRIALTVLAVPLFVTGIGTGGLLSTVVVAAVSLLWLQPARDWFDGRWEPTAAQPPSPSSTRTPPAPPTAAPPAPQDRPGAQEQPPPYAGWPAPQHGWPPPPQQHGWPPPQSGWPPPSGAPAGPAAPAAPPQASAVRPPAVVAAAVITWVCSVLLGGLFVAGSVWLIASPDPLMDEMTRQSPELVADGTVTVDLLRVMLVVIAGGIAVWVLVACVAAFFVLRRAGWARVLLLLSSGAAAVGLVVLAFVNAAMVLPLAGAAGVVALLLRRDVTAWFARR